MKRPLAPLKQVKLQEYQAFLIGHDGDDTYRVDLPCADEASAMERAKQLAEGVDVGLWQDNRKIATFPRRH